MTPDASAATKAAAQALESEVHRLLDIHDALGDLALAEGVHQATQGNFDRASAMVSTMTTGNYPPQPAVVQTPLKGSVLTHRIGLHLDTRITETDPEKPPRRLAEPALNQWLQEHLPLSQVACTVRWVRPPRDGDLPLPEITVATQVVKLSELAIEPMDWLAIVPLEPTGQLAELDDRVLRHVFDAGDQHPGINWRIEYDTAPSTLLSVAAVAPLTRALRTLIQKSRPLKPVDITREDSDTESALFSPDDIARIKRVQQSLNHSLQQVQDALDQVAGLLRGEASNRDAIIATVDQLLSDLVEVLEGASRFGILQTGWGFLFRARFEIHKSVQEQVARRTEQMREKLKAHRLALDALAALPGNATDDVRIRELRRAETALLSQLMDQPPSMAAFVAAVEQLGVVFLEC